MKKQNDFSKSSDFKISNGVKKILPLILPVFIFLPTLLYLHQKVQIYVEAYRLSNNYCYYNELLDKRDFLMYNFAKEVSLAKVNQWARFQNFTLVDKRKIMALNTQQEKTAVPGKVASLFSRFLGTSASASTALAKE